jgi:HPt (histidine-containing phosphotransfer) domain-containing protein
MEEKHYNLDYLESISGGDKEFVLDMVGTFITNVPGDIANIRSLIAAGNWQKVGEDSHRFASSLLFMGLEDLKLIAVQIEENGLGSENLEQIPGLLDKLEQGCNQIVAELKRDFTNIK